MPESGPPNPKSSPENPSNVDDELDDLLKEEEDDEIHLPESPSPSDDDSEDDDSDSESEDEDEEDEDAGAVEARRAQGAPEVRKTASKERQERTVREFLEILYSVDEKEEEASFQREIRDLSAFDFPEDPEKWTETDLGELWTDRPKMSGKPGWDPDFADEKDWEAAAYEVMHGRRSPAKPFYVPYRKAYPVITKMHDMKTPKGVIEELARIEEFLTWVSYVFKDGSSYEGTVWDDCAHGKGVWVAEQGLVRYEGEWFQNQKEGHGVIEVDIPEGQPLPGSEREAEWRKQGKIITRDFMNPEDRKWLEMDIEDSVGLANGEYEIPWYESNEWVKQFGRKPEKGLYRYAGQWKHGRAHGCGVYEVNERVTLGKFYFGIPLKESRECTDEISMMHGAIAEVAGAKARMFAYKPDGMVRELRGPFSDPQHPYFYEEEDIWMAPGFINQFFEVPDYWKRYVEGVDEEREMWINSFYRAPLRLPGPAELSYRWSNEEPEFILVNKEPEPDPENPSKLVYSEDRVILHIPTGRILNPDDVEGVGLSKAQSSADGKDIKPTQEPDFIPVGDGKYFGRKIPVKENGAMEFVNALESIVMPLLNGLEKWYLEQKKAREFRLELIDRERKLREAEISLQKGIDEMDFELKLEQEEKEKCEAQRIMDEEEKREAKRIKDEEEAASYAKTNADMVAKEDDEAEVEDEEEEEDGEEVPWSFGSANQDSKSGSDNKKSGKSSPFASLSLPVALNSMMSSSIQVPQKLRGPFQFCSNRGATEIDKSDSGLDRESPSYRHQTVYSVSFPSRPLANVRIRTSHRKMKFQPRTQVHIQLHSLARVLRRNDAPHMSKNLDCEVENCVSARKSESTSKQDICCVLCLQIPL